MIEIEKGRIDSFEVGGNDSRNGRVEIQQNGITYYFEIENNIIMTVSTQSLKEFVVNGSIVNFNNLADFQKRENPFVNGDIFIFPEIQLSVYVDFENKEFLQVLVYDKSLESLYVKNYPRYNTLHNQSLNLSKTIIFEPFESLGEFVFGMSIEDFKKKFDLSIEASLGVKGKEVINIDPLSFRFYSNKLTEIFIDSSQNKELQILVGNVNLNDISNLENMVLIKKKIERRGHIVFPELGLSVSQNLRDKEFFFYDKYLLQFWENVNRPFTSW